MADKHTNIDFILNKDRIYTSYFSKAGKILPDRRLVSISLTSPDGFKGEFYRDLNPSPSLLSQYKSGNISEEEYEEQYTFETLSRLDPIKVYNDLKGKAMCCWESSEKFCHRHLVVKWLRKRLGDEYIYGEI